MVSKYTVFVGSEFAVVLQLLCLRILFPLRSSRFLFNISLLTLYILLIQFDDQDSWFLTVPMTLRSPEHCDQRGQDWMMKKKINKLVPLYDWIFHISSLLTYLYSCSGQLGSERELGRGYGASRGYLEFTAVTKNACPIVHIWWYEQKYKLWGLLGNAIERHKGPGESRISGNSIPSDILWYMTLFITNTLFWNIVFIEKLNFSLIKI